MDGFEATKIIRKKEREKKLKNRHFIVALTSNSSPEIEEACYKAGMDMFT